MTTTVYRPQDYGAYADGGRYDDTALKLCDAACQAGPAGSVISLVGHFRSAGGYTIASETQCAQGARLAVDTGGTLTFSGLVTGWEPQATVFNGAGTVTLSGGYTIPGGGGVPSGTAGGSLSGTYPNPGLANGAATGAALGADVATLTGAQSLTNKTLDFTSNVWTRIARQTPSGVATATFASIPQGYRHLVLIAKVRDSGAGSTFDGLNVQMNGDSGNNYTWQYVSGAGTTLAASATTDTPAMQVGLVTQGGAVAGGYGDTIAYLLDYTDATNAPKRVTATSGGYTADNATGGLCARAYHGVWHPAAAAAITSLTVGPSAGNFAAGSVVELWGIA